MEKSSTNNQRIDVGDYVLNRGRFVVGGATVRLSVGFYGVYSPTLDVDWSDIASQDAPLWVGSDIGPVWTSVARSKKSMLYGSSEGIVAVYPNMRGDSSSTREYGAAHLLPGAVWSEVSQVSADFWAVIAFRTVSPVQNGALVSLSVGATELVLSTDGDRYVLRIGDLALGYYERSTNDFSVTVAAIGVSGDTAYLLLREGLLVTEGSWTTNYKNLVSSGFRIGGESSPGMLVYAASSGPGPKSVCTKVFDEFKGYLSC